MPESFDPYLKWLAIPQAEQPPNHYRLLGIPLFMKDTEVISNAADQRMVHVKSFQSGEHVVLSQQLLNEISTARACLLDAAKKTVYDAELRRAAPAEAWRKVPARVAPTPTPVPARAPAQPAAESGAWPSPDEGRPLTSRLGKGSSLKRKQQNNNLGVILAPVVVLLIVGLGGLLWSYSSGSSAKQTASNVPASTTSLQSASAKSGATTAANPQRGQQINTFSDPSGRGAPELPDVPPLNLKNGGLAKTNPELPGVDGLPQPVIPKEGKPGDDTAKTGSQPAVKLPTPDEASRAKALGDIKTVMSDDYAKLEKPELADKLLKYAEKSEKDPARSYALYREATRAAVYAADVPLIIKTVDAMAGKFEGIDAAEIKIESLKLAARGATREASAPLAASILTFTQTLVGENDFETAQELTETATMLARRASDKEVVQQSVARKKEIVALRKDYEQAEGAIAQLKKTPTDPDANLAAGKYIAMVKGDWEKGLPLLAAGSDEELKKAATQDLAHPTETDQQVAAGDAWWNESLSVKGISRTHLQSRAAHWYQQALLRLKDDFLRSKLQRRVDDANRATEVAAGATDKSGVTADRVVVFNTHNRTAVDRGTAAFNIVLRRKGVTVWEKKQISLPWDSLRAPSVEERLPRIPFDALRIEVVEIHNTSGGLTEIEVYSGKKNIAQGRPATASGVWNSDGKWNFGAANVTDGITDSAAYPGYWLLPDKVTGWVEIDFSPPHGT